MLLLYDMSSQDIIYSASEISPYTAPNEGINLNISGDIKLNFIAMVNNENFDNDDNPFGNFVLHMYTNMENLDDTNTEEAETEDKDSES